MNKLYTTAQPRLLVVLLLLGGLILAGCQATEPPQDTSLLPTLLPTAAVPVQVDPSPTVNAITHGTLTASEDSNLAATALPDEGEITGRTSPVPTAMPTIASTATPDLAIEPAINITGVTNDGRSLGGGQIALSGRGQARSNQTVEAVLLSLDGRPLSATPVTLSEYNTFEVALSVPRDYSGQALAFVGIFDANGQSVVQARELVEIAADETNERFLRLFRPEANQPAVSGYYLFFDGWAERPVRNLVRIAVLAEDCRTSVAQQSFVLNGSGYWQGFIAIPPAVEGDVCALASFGDDGDPNRREVQMRVNVLPRNDEDAARIEINNPPPGLTYRPGQQVALYGIASNALNDEVRIELLMADGRIAATETIPVQRFGYWETTVLLPVEAAEELQLTAMIGPPADSQAEAIMILEVEGGE